jgi:quinol monooxygenase YgiN
MRYGRFGSMTTHPGKRDAVVRILLRDVERLREAGCEQYVVNVSGERPDIVWVTEVWSSGAAHRASLQLPSVRQAISEAMPMLTGEFESVEYEVVGGLGLGGEPAGQPGG